MKVLFISNQTLPNEAGISSYVFTLKKEYEKRNIKVDVLSTSDKNYLTDKEWQILLELKRLLITQYGINFNNYLILTEISRLILEFLLAKINVNDYDIIHAQDGISSEVIKRVYPKKPLVATIHGSNYGESVRTIEKIDNRMEELLKKYDYDVVNQPDKIITVSSYLDPYMIDIPSFKHEIVHNGIDKTFFKPTEKKKNKSKKLLAVGRLSEIKSYDTLLRALVALKNEGITPETVLCGDGVKTDEYKTFAQKYKLNVKFTGNINQEKVRNYMQECDIFIHPSKVETFGLVITEAMACGCVPVASNVGGIKDQINHKENGLMFEQGDVSTLVSHIKTLLNDETFYETLKEKAIKSTEQFTIEKSADKTISIYKELLKR